MVKKLCKYECLSFARTMLPFEGILLGLAVLCRCVQFFEVDTVAYEIVSVSSIVALCVAMVVGVVMVVVTAVSRFYKSLYTSEGYLTFCLPVTPGQLLLSKLLIAMLFFLITAVSIALAGCIATLGDVLWEVFRAIGYLANEYFSRLHGDGILYLIECIVLLVLFVSQTYLLFCGCITVGQLSKKNRILMAFLAYFIYYIITQVVGTVFVVIFAVNGEAIERWIEAFITRDALTFVHLALCLGIVISALFNVLYGFVIHRIMKNRLNLE